MGEKPGANQTALAFFIPGLNGGGAQKVVVNLANALVDLTDRPVHIVLARAEGEFLDEVRPEVKVVDLGTGRASRSIFALARYLRKERPAVLCSSLNYANVCASVAWHLAGKPCRLVLREDNVVRAPAGNAVKKMRGHLMQRLMGLLYRRADTVVALGEAVASTLQDRGICQTDHIKIIGNPVTVQTSPSTANDEPGDGKPWGKHYIVAVGRLARQKGFDTLIESFAKVKDKDCDLVILGEGELRGELEALAKNLGIAQRVHMPGFVKNPHSVMASAQLFVLSSRWEGFGLVIVEALALGAPVVATDCSGAPRALLRDGELGHLVPVYDPDALAEAITEALHSPRGTREARQERARDFAAPAIARQYLEEAFGLEANPSRPEIVTEAQ
ncbi:glycosyltransferase [Thioalkalivibrio sp. ALgr3]|uniref:glycosyltransferase n=1 Tax=Thioalkalivibrio sp. ALgr3 TaxID=1239292 RepID=UPI00056F0C74|nr:glycosyltransferase [Thioalkalivibrio sp. ALgr3]